MLPIERKDVNGESTPVLDCFYPGRESAEGRQQRRTVHSLVGKYKFEDDDALHLIDAAWPLIKEIQRSTDMVAQEEARYGKPEFTVSLFQGGRSLYVSSLGSLEPQLESRESPPIVYTVIVSYHSRWALGRLVERIHQMASFRLAAMRDVDKLIEAGNYLKKIEDNLRNDESRGIFDGERYSTEILKAGRNIRYGLMHRVRRSAFYVREFERVVKAQRICRVDGFQQYDRFVERRVYGAFDYIKRVGDRYRSLRQDVDLILRKNNLSAIRDATKASEALLKATNGVEQQLRDNAAQTNDLLDNAEKIIAIPLIYYIGHVLTDVTTAIVLLVPNIASAFGIKGKWPLLFDEEMIRSAMYLLSVGGVLWGLKVLKEQRERKERKREQQRSGAKKYDDADDGGLGDGQNNIRAEHAQP